MKKETPLQPNEDNTKSEIKECPTHLVHPPQPTGTTGSENEPDFALMQTPDGSGTGIILSVGKTVDGFEPRNLSLNISDTRLNQLNIGVVGDLGTGKTLNRPGF